jgi:hypothetical protein
MEPDPEKVEVKRANSSHANDRPPSIFARLNNAIAPLAGGILIDTLDIATFGPVGLYFGLFIGFAAGWWITSVYRFEKKTKLIWSLLAGIYCMTPGTAFFPLATVISVIGRFSQTPKQ